MTVFLHFDKQMVRVQKNRADRKWDKFIMSELRGKTVGFVGFGSIAQATARLCRAFGMRILALRRSKEGPGSELADEVFSYEEARPPPTKAKPNPNGSLGPPRCLRAVRFRSVLPPRDSSDDQVLWGS